MNCRRYSLESRPSRSLWSRIARFPDVVYLPPPGRTLLPPHRRDRHSMAGNTSIRGQSTTRCTSSDRGPHGGYLNHRRHPPKIEPACRLSAPCRSVAHCQPGRAVDGGTTVPLRGPREPIDLLCRIAWKVKPDAAIADRCRHGQCAFGSLRTARRFLRALLEFRLGASHL